MRRGSFEPGVSLVLPLSLEDEVPNHSTFSKNRHGRFRDSSLFRWLFNEVLRRCMDAGLVKGHGPSLLAYALSNRHKSGLRQVDAPQLSRLDPGLRTPRVFMDYFAS
jgi:hypothetical protein